MNVYTKVGGVLSRSSIYLAAQDNAVVNEKAGETYSAYVPDLPNCVAAGATSENAEREIAAAIRFHLEGLIADSLPIPEPLSRAAYVDA